ncbi:MAG: xylulokinase [Planctomycetes bacterium]|nr:xylulokinase [Planctomycetota bacterium]
MPVFLGIDVSTTATKALLIDAAGAVLGVASSEYAFESPHPLWSEQHPDLWWTAACASVRKVLAATGVDPASIAAIGLTGQMHGLVLLDADGKPLRPAILWNDQRTGAECDEIRTRVGRERLIAVTGNDALTGFTAPKILWVRNHEPGIFARVRHILLPHDFVRLRLTGEYASDKAGASGTILFDLAKRDWSPEILAALGIDRAWLPRTVEGTAATGAVTKDAAALTGLRAGTPVFGGGGDQAAAAVGTGAVEEGIVSVSLGTSGVVFAACDKPFIEPQGRLHAFCHALPGKWHLMGVMLSAAGSLRWFRDTFAPGEDFEALVGPAADVAPGSDGLIFLPYLTGERTPHNDPLARGAFVGITVRHTRAHFVRAVLEGVAFGLRDGFDLMRGAGLAPFRQVRVTGGGAKSALWRQILADVFGTEIATVSSAEGAAFGAALLAAAGSGAELPAAVRVPGSTSPSPAAADYPQIHQRFRALYPALTPDFRAAAGQA